jgi:cysteinyl-tRNA synthetase
LKEEGFLPMHYKYFALTSHYRSQAIFSMDAMISAKNTYENLIKKVIEIKKVAEEPTAGAEEYIARFRAFMEDDLATPQAVATLWEVLKDDTLSAGAKLSFILFADQVFSLGLTELQVNDEQVVLTEEMQEIIAKRVAARVNKEWARSDELRDELARLGVGIKDKSDGTFELKRL